MTCSLLALNHLAFVALLQISFAQVTVQTVEKALKNVSDDLLVEKCRM